MEIYCCSAKRLTSLRSSEELIRVISVSLYSSCAFAPLSSWKGDCAHLLGVPDNVNKRTKIRGSFQIPWHHCSNTFNGQEVGLDENP